MSASRSRSRSRSGSGKKDDVKEDKGSDLSKVWGTSGQVIDLKTTGYGFIRPDTGKVDDRDMFFSATDCATRFNEFHIGDEVAYEPKWDKTKNKATGARVKLVKQGNGGRGR